MSVQGKLFEEGGAASVAATFFIRNGTEYEIVTESGRFYGQVSSLSVSNRLGNIPRNITTVDGHVFTTSDNDGIDACLKRTTTGLSLTSLVHKLETNMLLVVVACVVTIVAATGVLRYGVPSAANSIAEALPAKTNQLIGRDSLEFLDKYMLEPSELDEHERERVSQYFYDDLLPALRLHTDLDLGHTLYFRAWPSKRYEDGIPNALALPGGEIVLTDQFVRLTKSDDELAAVLLHEIGHVHHRHSLKTVIRSALYSGLIAVMLGDLNAVGDIGVAIGTLLVQSKHSRMHETEADDFSFEHMLLMGIDPEAFVSIFESMDAYIASTEEVSDEEESTDENKWFDYISSHPATDKRLDQARIYAECFRNGLTVCE